VARCAARARNAGATRFIDGAIAYSGGFTAGNAAARRLPPDGVGIELRPAS